MSVRYQNIPRARDAPPEYNLVTETPAAEPLIMKPIREEIKQVAQRKSPNQLIKRYVYGFTSGFLFCLVIFLVCTVFWKRFENFHTERDLDSCDKRIVGYYRGWENIKITERQLEKLTHVIFDGIKWRPDGKIDFESDERRLLFLDLKNKVKTMQSGIKIMFSTEMENVESFSSVLADSKQRKNLVNSFSSFIIEHQLDGVELHYRWPKTVEQVEVYLFLIRELRYKLEKLEKLARRKIPYIVSVRVPPFGWTDENIPNDFLEYADFLSVETDNYHGPWHSSGVTGAHVPLFSTYNNRSADWTLKTYTCSTLKPSRLNFVLSFHGAYWENVSSVIHDDVYRNVEIEDNKRLATAYKAVKTQWNLTSAKWHEQSQTPYIWDADSRTLLSFEDERSLLAKVKYAVEKNLGGITINRIEVDDDSNTLLNAVTSVDLCSGPKFGKDEVQYICEKNGFKQEYLLNESRRSTSIMLLLVLSLSLIAI